MKKRLKILATVVASLILLTLLGVFIFKEKIVATKLDNYISLLSNRYGITMTYENIEVSTSGKIELHYINLTQAEDTLATIDTAEVSFPFIRTLLGARKIDELKIANAELYPFKYKKPQREEESEKEETTQSSTDKESRIVRLFKMMDKINPDAIEITNITSHTADKLGINQYKVDRLAFRKNAMVLLSNITDTSGRVQPFNWEGTIGLNNTGLSWVGDEPFRLKLGKGELGFKKISLFINKAEEGYNYEFWGEEIMLQHYRITDSPVLINNVSVFSNLLIDEDGIKTIGESNVELNNVQVSWYLDYVHNLPRELKANFNIYSEVKGIQNAIPKGLFKKLDKLDVEGFIGYDFSLYVDFSNLDSLQLTTEVDAEKFKINSLAKSRLNIMNDTFTYIVKSDDSTYGIKVGLGDSIIIGDYTPFSQVPRHLVDAILTNEDPSFFRHRGFIPSAFRESLITNIKERRFKRGGSTISMQLVKNLFLSGEKTLARKIEEIILVWILENKRIATKERMFEVYLNIIEWGPNVRGVKRAAKYYFNKEPSELTLEESLFMASVIPRPGKFKYHYDKEGNIRPHYQEQFRFIKDLMVKRELITPADTANFNPNVQLTGRAKKVIEPLVINKP